MYKYMYTVYTYVIIIMNHMYVCIQCNYMYIVYIICMIRIYMLMCVCARKFIQHISGQTGNGIWLDLRHYLTCSTCFLPEKSESPDETGVENKTHLKSTARHSGVWRTQQSPKASIRGNHIFTKSQHLLNDCDLYELAEPSPGAGIQFEDMEVMIPSP